MICRPCRYDKHRGCAEQYRQRSPRLTAAERAGGALCDCQHMLRRPGGIRVTAVPGMPEGIIAVCAAGSDPVLIRTT